MRFGVIPGGAGPSGIKDRSMPGGGESMVNSAQLGRPVNMRVDRAFRTSKI